MKRQCPPKFTSLGYSKRSMNGGPLAQIPERNEGKETCSETIVTIHLFMMKKTHVFDGNIWRLVEGYFAYRHRLEQIWQADCKPWVQLWKFIKPHVENDQTSRSFQLPWQIYGNCFFLYFVLQNLMKQIPVAFMFLFHGLSWNSFPYFCSAIVQPLWKHKQH